MKTKILPLLAFVLFINCQPTSSSDSELTFTIDHFDVPNNQMEITIEITNPTAEVWEGGQWSLHWNQFSGVLKPESLPEDIRILPTKNRQYWQLEFGASHTLNPGASLRFSVTQSDIMRRLVMGPLGFFVHSNTSNKNYDLKSVVHWENAKGVTDLNLPSAKDRYGTYEGITSLDTSALHWVVPTPKKTDVKENYRPYPKSLLIDFGSFNEDTSFLLNHFQKGLKLEVSQAQEGAQLEIKKNKSLGEEAYQLKLTENKISLETNSYSGLFYGMTSLHQIFLTAEKEGNGLPLIHLEDAPRFGHRGFMVDLSRNFFPKEKVLQILDYMAFYKLNLLDIKLSDDEGWRIEIPGLEELTEVGGKRGYTKDESDRLFPMYGSGSGEVESRGSGYLSRKDFIEILEAAKQRNIRVVPQLSFPSHARAAVIAMKARYDNYLVKGDVEAANEYRLHDPNDQSEYTSAQLFQDNTICICAPSSFRFFEKVFTEIKAMYTEADLPMKTYNIGADELPFGVWRKSPLCEEFIRKTPTIDSYQSLYDYSVNRLNEIVTASGAQMAGWEDVLLSHSEKSQSEIEVNKNLMDLDFIPSVWNNTWQGGREDMIYKLTNLGFKAVMSNSSAFYFDMTDDTDMENSGLSWSGFVSYKDSWGTEPLNVFANKVKLQELGIDENEVAKKTSIQKEAIPNFLGIQSQLWTETAKNSYEFDRMLMPNMIVFAERAWSPKEKALEEKTAALQKPKLDASWNIFVNTIGQRQLPHLTSLFQNVAFDLPKPGAVIEEGMLKVRQQFPGLQVRYSLDGTAPTMVDTLYTTPVEVSNSDQIVLRVFDTNGRAGNTISIP